MKTQVGHGDGVAADTVAAAPGDPVVARIESADTVASSPGQTAPGVTGLAQVSAAHYDVGAELARGGMGRITKAHDRRLGREVALKELLGGGDAMVLRFEREALVTSRLQHPAIVPVYEAGRWPTGEPFFAMKLVNGRSLDKAIAECADFVARLGLLATMIHVCEAIAYAHGEKVIHRDLKPGNVLVGSFGETVVIDWGLAKDLRNAEASDVVVGPYRSTGGAAGAAPQGDVSSGDLTMAGSVMGTPTYMPPEQARGEAVDASADVYALGAMLYHVLAGVAPYRGKDARAIVADVIAGPPRALASLVPEVPQELAAIVAKAMARGAGDRYPSAMELADELVRFQAGKLVAAHHYSAWALVRRWVQRHRAVVVATASIVAIAAIAAGVSITKIVAARDDATTALAAARVEREAFLEEQGRRELLDGHPARAAVYLDEAYGIGEPSDTLRLLLAQAMPPIDALVATLDTGGPVARLVVAPDGGELATQSGGHVALWSAGGKAIATLDAGVREVGAIAFSADRTRVAVGGAGGPVTVWSAAGAKLATLAGTEGATAIAFATPAHVLVSAGRTIVSWDAGTGAKLASIDNNADGFAVSAGGSRVVMTSNLAVEIADLATLATRWPVAPTTAPRLAALAGDRIVVATEVPRAQARRAGIDAFDTSYDDATPPPAADTTPPTTTRFDVLDTLHPDVPLATFSYGGGAIVDMVADAHGRRALVTPRDGQATTLVALVAPEPGTPPGSPLENLPPSPVAALSADGTRVALAIGDEIQLWDDARHLLARFPIGRRGATALAFAGDHLVAAGEAGARIWTLPPSTREHALDVAPTAGSLFPDGRRVAAIQPAGVVIEDLVTGAREVIRAAPPPPARLWSATVSPDGARVATTASDGHVIFWDVAARKASADLATLAFRARFSPDGARVVTSGERDAFVWDAATGAKLATLAGDDDLVQSARFSADGARVVTAAMDGTARIYDARTGATLRTLTGHTDYLVDAAFDPSGAHVVTASADGTARIWRVATGDTTWSLRGHTTALRSAEFSPDGARVVTAGSEGARVWDAATGRLEIALPSATEVSSATFASGGALIAVVGDDGATLVDATRGVPIAIVPAPVPPDPLVTTMGRVASPVHDPRAATNALVEAPDHSWVATARRRVELPREHRSPAEIHALVTARSGWRLAGGALVPASEAVYRTDEVANVGTGGMTFDFDDDPIAADIVLSSDISLGTAPIDVLPRELRAPPDVADRAATAAWESKVQAVLPAIRDAALAAGTEDALDAAARAEEVWGDPKSGDRDRLYDRVIAAFPASLHAIPRRIHRALFALDDKHPARAHELVDALPALPDLDGKTLRELAWIRRAFGDDAGAYRTVAAAAARTTGEMAKSLRIDVARAAAEANIAPADALATLAALPGAPDRATLADALAKAYRLAGESDAESTLLADQVPTAAPDRLLAIRRRQAQLALSDGRTRDVTTHAVEALAILDAHPELVGEVRADAEGELSRLAQSCGTTYAATRDERYARTALDILHAFAAHPRTLAVDKLAAAIESSTSMIATGPVAVGAFNKEALRRAVRQRADKIRRCYERALVKMPDLDGRLVLSFTVRDGELSDVTWAPDDGGPLSEVGRCAAGELQHVVLPRAAYARPVRVNYPLVFVAM